MRQTHLGRYLGFQAYLLAFIQRLENIMYKEVLLIKKSTRIYTTFSQCGQKEIHAKSEKTQHRIWLILLLCAGLSSYRLFLRTGSKSLCFSLPNPWCLPSAVYVYLHTCIGCGDDEYGRPGEMSMEEVDILLFIPDLESKDGLWWLKGGD